MMLVLPWLDFPRPKPSFQPILCNILLPMLSPPMLFSGRLSHLSNSPKYFSFNLLGLTSSSASPYFRRRSLALSRYCWGAWGNSDLSFRNCSRFCLCNPDMLLCLNTNEILVLKLLEGWKRCSFTYLTSFSLEGKARLHKRHANLSQSVCCSSSASSSDPSDL